MRNPFPQQHSITNNIPTCEVTHLCWSDSTLVKHIQRGIGSLFFSEFLCWHRKRQRRQISNKQISASFFKLSFLFINQFILSLFHCTSHYTGGIVTVFRFFFLLLAVTIGNIKLSAHTHSPRSQFPRIIWTPSIGKAGRTPITNSPWINSDLPYEEGQTEHSVIFP